MADQVRKIIKKKWFIDEEICKLETNNHLNSF